MVKKKSSKRAPRCVDYQITLLKRLKDHAYAVEYLNAALEESLSGDTESQKLLLVALKNVAEAQGSISSLAKRAKIRRESIYRMLSEEGNPYLQSFTALVHAMGFNIRLY